MGAVRSNEKTHWVSPRVQKYHQYLNLLRREMQEVDFIMPESDYLLQFYFSMPDTWSKKKKALMLHQPNQQKPDKDNLEKGFMDAYFYKKRIRIGRTYKQSKENEINGDTRDDKCVWSGLVEKYWAEEGKVVITIFNPGLKKVDEIRKALNPETVKVKIEKQPKKKEMKTKNYSAKVIKYIKYLAPLANKNSFNKTMLMEVNGIDKYEASKALTSYRDHGIVTIVNHTNHFEPDYKVNAAGVKTIQLLVLEPQG
jgi:Holliday junction resolvase RusA-like endonuclease